MMHCRIVVVFCLLIAGLRVQASLPDSLRAELAGLPDSAQIKLLIDKSVAQMYRNTASAEKLLALAAEIASRPENAAWQPKVINQRGTLSWVRGDHKAALASYQEAERRFTAQGDAMGAAKAQNNIGLVYQDMSYFDLSLAAYLKAATFFEAQEDRHALATIYNNIGNVSNSTGDDQQAEVYYHKALDLFTQFRDTNGMSMAHNNLGLVIKAGGRQQEATAHFHTALQGYEALDYPVGQAKVLHNLAGLHANQGRFPEAESLALRALHLAEEMDISGEIAISRLKLSEIYLKWGRYDMAISQAQASLAAGEGNIALLAEASAHEVLAAAYEKTGQYAPAFSHLKTHKMLNDSVFNMGKSRAIEEMRIKFDLALKDKALENFAQKQRLDSFLQVGLGVVIVLLLLLGAMIYARQRAIIRREKALQQKDREVHATQTALREAELKTAEAEVNATASNLKAAESERLRLQEEVSYKSREISGLAMNIVRQNDLLEVLDRELKSLRKGADEQKLKELSQLVSQTLSLENERKEFQLFIQEAQQNFFLRLEAAFPDLSPKEKRLCAMIKLGLSSKEIAAVFNIAGSSVEVARHRLRKRLNLDHSVALKEFLENF